MFELRASKEPRIPSGFQLNANDIQSTVSAFSSQGNEVLLARICRTDVAIDFVKGDLLFFFKKNFF